MQSKHRAPISLPNLCLVFCSLLMQSNVSLAVDYNQDIAPIMAKNCVACHNAKKTEGGLNLESFEALMKGGDSGDSITAGKSADSYLMWRVTGEEEPVMPPEDNAVGARRLNEDELSTLRAWIDAGAEPPSSTQPVRNLAWQSLPQQLRPIYAMASSADGQWLAFGRGNQALLASTLNPKATSVPLSDPTLQGQTHRDIVQSMAFSPDSQRLATGGYRNIKIWQRSSEAKTLLKGLPPTAHTFAFSPNGQRLAFAADENVLEIVNIESGVSNRFLQAHDTAISGIVWTDDERVLSADISGSIRLCNGITLSLSPVTNSDNISLKGLSRFGPDTFLGLDAQGRLLELTLAPGANHLQLAARKISELPEAQQLYACSRESNRALVADGSGTVFRVNLENGETESKITCGAALQMLAVDTAFELLISVDQQGKSKLWKQSDGSLVAELSGDYHFQNRALAAQRDVNRQASLIAVLTKKVPELKKASEKEAEAQKKVAEARTKAAESLAAADKTVADAEQGVADAEKAVADAEVAVAAAMKRVEEMNTNLEAKKKALGEVQTKRSAAQGELAKRDQALAAANDSATRAAELVPEMEARIESEQKRLQELESSQQDLQSKSVFQGSVRSLAVSPDASQFFLAGDDDVIRVYSSDGKPVGKFDAPESMRHLECNTAGLTGVSASGRLVRWTQPLAWRLERSIGTDAASPFSDRITALDFSPDGRWLAVGSGPPSRFGDVQIIDVTSGELFLNLEEIHSDTVFGLRFSPDGRYLVTASADKQSRLFELPSGKFLRAFEGHSHHVLGVAWRDDGQSIATASADATVKIWNVETGEQRRTITGFSKEVSAAQFVGQSSQLVTCGVDGRARLHNVDDGKQLRVFNGAAEALFAVAASEDGSRVSAAGQRGLVWTWNLKDGKLLETTPAEE